METIEEGAGLSIQQQILNMKLKKQQIKTKQSFLKAKKLRK